jgi:hypothetical protein
MSFLHHPGLDVSVLLSYRYRDEVMMIVLGEGNAYEGINPQMPAQSAQTYSRFPTIPVFGAISNHSVLLVEGTAHDLGLYEYWQNDNLYIVSTDYIYVYGISQPYADADIVIYIADLMTKGFEVIRASYNPEGTIWATLLEATQQGQTIHISLLYAYPDDELWVVIG